MKKEREKYSYKLTYTILIAFAIISFWRGIWGLMDEFLFPNNPSLSFLISILIGILLLSSTKNIARHLI